MNISLGSIAKAFRYLGNGSSIRHEPAYDSKTQISYGAGVITKNGADPGPLREAFLSGRLLGEDQIAYHARGENVDVAFVKMNGTIIEIGQQGIFAINDGGKMLPTADHLKAALAELKAYGNSGYDIEVPRYVHKDAKNPSQGYTLAPHKTRVDVSAFIRESLESKLKELR